MSSGSSWASWRGGGARLDFTPTPADDGYFAKSDAFWQFVRSRPELQALCAVPERAAPPPVAPVREAVPADGCLEKLAKIAEKGELDAALASRVRGLTCGAGGGDSTPPHADPGALALARELREWDKSHNWERVPHSRTPAPPAPRRRPRAAAQPPLCCRDN